MNKSLFQCIYQSTTVSNCVVQLKRAALLASMSLLSVASNADARYVAEPHQSQWEMSSDTPMLCQLTHDIPNYGKAIFKLHAGRKVDLEFGIEMLRPMGQTRDVTLMSMPPFWYAGQRANRIVDLQFFQQFDGYVANNVAWRMLAELEKGNYPTFSYPDWQNQSRFIEVALSSVLFREKYAVFSQCLSRLLPFNFEDISFTILHYERGEGRLSTASQRRLNQIMEYLKYNKDVELVLVSAYTDSFETDAINKQLSDERARSLQKYLEEAGLQDRVQIESFGASRFAQGNESPVGRDNNRRVVISLSRSSAF